VKPCIQCGLPSPDKQYPGTGPGWRTRAAARLPVTGRLKPSRVALCSDECESAWRVHAGLLLAAGPVTTGVFPWDAYVDAWDLAQARAEKEGW